MRAVSLAEAHRLELVELDRPEPGPGELLVRVEACGLCGSDLSTYKLGLGSGVLGHEIGGVVEELGDGVTGFATGDRVCLDPKIPCGACADCLSGHENRCIDTLTGQSFRPGGYAEWLVAPARILAHIPDGVPTEVGALAEPLSVAVHAVGRTRLRPGEPALVVGLGSIGMLTVIALRAAGAGPIFAIEPLEERRALGIELGVERAVASAGAARTSLDRVPVVVEASGRPEAVQIAIDMADSGGRVAMAGIAVAEVPMVPVFLITRELELLGSICATRDEFMEAVSLLPAFPELAAIISTRLRLADLPGAFASLAEGHYVGGKAIAVPGLG